MHRPFLLCDTFTFSTCSSFESPFLSSSESSSSLISLSRCPCQLITCTNAVLCCSRCSKVKWPVSEHSQNCKLVTLPYSLSIGQTPGLDFHLIGRGVDPSKTLATWWFRWSSACVSVSHPFLLIFHNFFSSARKTSACARARVWFFYFNDPHAKLLRMIMCIQYMWVCAYLLSSST